MITRRTAVRAAASRGLSSARKTGVSWSAIGSMLGPSVAGVTREAGAAGERLPDRVSIGVLVRTFTDEVIDDVIDAAGVREQRYRLLPARLVVLFTWACWLFTRTGYEGVMAKLADAHLLGSGGAAGGCRPWWRSAGPGSGSRRALAAAVRRGGRGMQHAGHPGGVFYAGLRVVTADGFTLDVPDTVENAAHFGRGGNGSASAKPYPQLWALVLAESDTRSLLAAAHVPCTTGKKTLALGLLPALGPGMRLVADRNFISYKLWTEAAATARTCAGGSRPRSPSTTHRPCRRDLPGPAGAATRVRRVPGHRPDRRVHRHHHHRRGKDEEISELFALATTLLDPAAAPAVDLAEVYQRQWPAEIGIADLKTAQRGGSEAVLRSQKPATVEQELYAMLCVYQAVRDLIGYATPTGSIPDGSASPRPSTPPGNRHTRAALSPNRQTGHPDPRERLAHRQAQPGPQTTLTTSPRRRRLKPLSPTRRRHAPRPRSHHTITVHRLEPDVSP